jgi:CDP-6-deoxy-D-xylo-4-hexulose-3-dehydrase
MWKLMHDNVIDAEDKHALSDFILSSDRFTKFKLVDEFETAWSEWQGCKYSVFVNSGSSANLILVDGLKHLFGAGPWVNQAITWSTNVAPVLQLGMTSQLCDISLDNFGPDLVHLEKIFESMSPKFLFLTHLIGFPAVTSELLGLCRDYNVQLVEDCCESCGANFGNKKVGNFGVASTFSFYYGHHMTTVEGGMVCTDNKELYHLLLLLRSHGLLRELPEEAQREMIVPGVDPYFTFLIPGYNVRSTEFHALLGIRQLHRLDETIEIRNRNLKYFFEHLDHTKYHASYNLSGVSSFCLPILARGDITKVKDCLIRLGVESRPLISGNLYRHPMMNNADRQKDVNAEFAHKQCVYVGNHAEVHLQDVDVLTEELNRL